MVLNSISEVLHHLLMLNREESNRIYRNNLLIRNEQNDNIVIEKKCLKAIDIIRYKRADMLL